MSETLDDPEIPTDMLVNLIITLLAPLFRLRSDSEIRFARMAATETVNAYRIDTQADLITVAQIVAFGLSALRALSLAMTEEIGLTMQVRMHSNANTMSKISESLRRSLAKDQRDRDQQAQPAPQAQPQPTQPKPAPPQQTAQQAAASQAVWANAVATVAREFAAEIATLPPQEREAAQRRVNAMNYTANQLRAQAGQPSVELGRQPGIPPMREHPSDMPGQRPSQR